MPSQHDIEKSDAFMSVSDQYLRLATAATRSIRDSGNQCISTPGELTHNEQTYYCDQNIGTAVIFNLFHGIELLLKALLLRAGYSKGGHKISELLSECQRLYPRCPISSTVHRYFPDMTSNSSLANFFRSQDLHPDTWYEALKYPKTKNGKEISHLAVNFSFYEDKELWDNLEIAFPEFRKMAVSAFKSKA
jgi:hypothetical protein